MFAFIENLNIEKYIDERIEGIRNKLYYGI